MMMKKIVLLTTVSGSMEAEILRSMLEANKIPVFLSGEAAGKAIGLGVGPLAEMELFVSEENLQPAQELLEAYLQEPDP